MNYSFRSETCSGTELECARYAPLDYIAQAKFHDPDQLSKLRNYRFGCLLIQFGLFCLGKNFLLMDSSVKKKPKKTPQSFNKNVWLVKLWQSVNFVTFALVLIIIELYLVHFSFTKHFADNVWLFLGVYKIIGITLSTILTEYSQNNFFAGIYAAVIGIIENLATLGAANFLDFLQSNLITAGIQMFERIYLASMIDIIVAWMKLKVGSFKEFFINLTVDNETPRDDQKETPNEKNTDARPEKSDLNGSADQATRRARRSCSRTRTRRTR